MIEANSLTWFDLFRPFSFAHAPWGAHTPRFWLDYARPAAPPRFSGCVATLVPRPLALLVQAHDAAAALRRSAASAAA